MSDEGRLVAGRYRVQRRIGSGAMGVVWECVDERLHRTVAVKQLLTQPGLDPAEAEEARQRAMREGRIAARLQHPHAVSVYDVAEENGEPVLVMEYLPSTSLASMMSEHGPLSPREVARIGAQVAAALGAAHSAGVVHRDIKPGNVLLGDEGTVKITDFGISRAQGDVAVTKTGMLAGTPAYLSPDVACGKEPSPASDVFSLGATLYAAIEGRPPFGQNENTLALLHSVAAGKVEPPRNAGPMTEPLLAMLRPNEEERPDMAQVHEMLQAVAEGQAVTSVPTKAAPIPPAMHPGTAAATDPPSNPRDGGTFVAGAQPEEGERYSGTGRADTAAYPGSDPRAEPVNGKRRGRTPLVVSGVLLVVAAVAGILVATSLLSDDSRPENPAGGGETSQPLVPPAVDETSATETTVPDYQEDDGYQDQDPDWNRTTTEVTEPTTSTSTPESSVERSSDPATEPSAPEDGQGDGTENDGSGEGEGSGGDGSGGDGSGDDGTGNDGTADGDSDGEDSSANGGQGGSSGDGS
ncbi:serine/threonine protein kinase [Actinopolyspora erythraea]|uniref:non-specific serine/threonine protein kinase n=1 Tax=Actinopolyspora erythraea TaxID=414996 RepID=A0A099D834_9ACTN|nr:serine/threonine-protein kinase [Actinopolyspora erythraea]ASU80064.1 serine/threonine protein kinase [Actinopolyspora erythraea]KGI82204.1 protein kinase [Actinopolyspora erythraea]